ncbi:hypothetical protein C5S32_05735 [ANME-1 cluster archaeon GoMg1]|nr:hypothetical protein [ANME-1 cluster archaeon GoMg1]
MIEMIQGMGIIQFIGVLTLFVALFTLFVATITFVHVRFADWRNELAVLRSLFQHLEYIKNAAKGQHEQMKKGGPIPSWTLISVDLDFYLPRVNYKIRTQGWLKFRKIYTRDLKNSIIKIADNVNKINNQFRLMYDSIVSNKSKNENEILVIHKKELLNKPYYEELYNFVDDAHRELRKILKPFKRNSLYWY